MLSSPVICIAFAAALMAEPMQAKDKRPAPQARPHAVRALAFSPDGRILVAGFGVKDQTGGTVAWEVEFGKPLWRVMGAPAISVSFVSDGTAVTVASKLQSAFVLDARTGKTLHELGPHEADVYSVAHLPQSSLVATASDGAIRLWDVKLGQLVRALAGGHPKEVYSVVASPNGKWIVAKGPDATRIWDVAAGVELKEVIKQDERIAYYGITFVAPDRVMMADNSGSQAVRELPSGKVLLRFQSEGGYMLSAYSEAAGLAAFAGQGRPKAAIAELTFRAPTAEEKAQINKLIKAFDDDSYDVREAATAAMREIGSFAVPALQVAATAGPSAEVRMRAREVRKAILDQPVRYLSGHTAGISALAFAPNGKIIATGSEDGEVRLWNPQTGKELARLKIIDAPPGGTP
jgi:WD40 repeat protein